MKLIICAVFAALFVQSFAQSHNSEWGRKNTTVDKQLFRDIYVKDSAFLQVVTEDLVVGTAGNTISYIKATDQYSDDNGGYATLLSGGVGNDQVKIHLKSKRNHGFNFIIEIWGH